ncbi:hypothetical protein J4210_02815 [Candidatus Woesearchaeota archaeon]|nr:hypothetical protein [uncultured archaeon]MBS3169392.1 hypothetical protein [Candidatus Woesearchaeota archaeon]
MNKNHLTSAIASTAAAFAFFALPYSARAEPPRTSSRTSQTTEICVDVTQLEDVCNDQYPCDPAPECPSGKARPRISRSKCADHYATNPAVVGLCLHRDDAARLGKLEGLIVEEGPDNLCPWGESYHCQAVSVEKVAEVVEEKRKNLQRLERDRLWRENHQDGPVKPSPRETDDDEEIIGALEDALKRARRQIEELKKRKSPSSGSGSGSSGAPPDLTIYIPRPRRVEHELFVSLGGLAPLTSTSEAFTVDAGYRHTLWEYLLLGVEASFSTGRRTASRSVSPGKELLPDGNYKQWEDVTTQTHGTVVGGIGSTLGVRLPVVTFGKRTQLYLEIQGGLHALWGTEESNKERTTHLTLPDGTLFMGPKTISEPQDEETITLFGASAGAGVGIRIPFDSSYLAIGANAVYLSIPAWSSHHLGGKVHVGVQF